MTAGTLALGCSTETALNPAPPRAPLEAASLELLLKDADVWAFEARVRGRARGAAHLRKCNVAVDGRLAPAPTDGAAFESVVRLREGENRVKAACRDGSGAELESNLVRLHVRLRDTPVARARVSLVRNRLQLDGDDSEPSLHTHSPLAEYGWQELGELPSGDERVLGSGARLSLPVPSDGLHTYELSVRDARGKSDSSRAVVLVRRGRVIDERPWLESAVVYGAVPPFFGEPPLRGLERSLDDLADLGVTALWLSPVFSTLAKHFGYEVTDFFSVRRDYGTAEDLKHLISEAHRRNLRVIIDLIPNHTSSYHRYFQQAAEYGGASHYFWFYARDEQREPTHYFGWEHLPNLNYDNSEVWTWLIEVAKYWMRDFQVDGYRVDAAWGVTDRQPRFWKAWTDELRRIDPELLLIAEASAREPFYAENGFDAAYDWTRELGHWAWEHVFDSETGIVERLDAALAETANSAPRATAVFRFLNNNDTRERFITRHGPGMNRVTTALLLTLPGIPCLYSFDEIGGEVLPYGGLYPADPPANPALREYHRKLIALRRESAALHGPGFVRIPLRGKHEVYAYLRHAGPEAQPAMVFLNFSARSAAIQASLPEPWAARLSGRWIDALGGAPAFVHGSQLTTRIAGWGVQVLLRKSG